MRHVGRLIYAAQPGVTALIKKNNLGINLSNQNNSEIMITIMMIIKIEGEEGEEKEVGHIVLEK